jgi:hypothetical protein
MVETRRIGVVAALALVSAGVLAIVLVGGRPADGPLPATATATPAASARGVPVVDDRPPVVVRDFVFETANVKSPTAQKAQSKLWYAEGAWWGGLLSPVTEQIHIFRLDWATQTWLDTGTVVDERPTADPDYLWTGDHLVVASAGTKPGAANGARILRFHFDRDLGRFVMDPDFPVVLTATGTNAIVIERDDAATVWVTYVSDGRVMVAHTLEDDARWTEPFALPGSGAVRPEDISSVVAFGPGRIGVMWSDQQSQRILFTSHADGAPDGSWSPVEVVTEGAGSADNHLNLKAFDLGAERVVAAAVKTSRDAVTDPNPLASQILVMIREPGGRWNGVEAGRVQDHHSRPVILIDEERRIMYLVAQSPFTGGAIYLKRASLDDPAFETGKGEPFIATETDPAIANATSTKQSISRATGLVVIASDDGTGRFVHAAIDLGGTPLSAQVATLSHPDTPESPDIGPTRYIDDAFDAWAIGSGVTNGWVDKSTGGSLAVAADDAERFLRLGSTAASEAAEGCKALPSNGGPHLFVDVRFRLAAVGDGQARLATVRIPGGEIVSLRAAADGQFSYFDGPTRVRTDLRLTDGRWYRARLDIDIVGRRTDIRILTAGDTAVLTRSGVAWRTDRAAEPDRVCVRVSGASATLDIDSVVVSR